MKVLDEMLNSVGAQPGSARRPTRGFSLPINLAALVLVIVSGAIVLGIGAYREVRFNRQLNDEQNRNLVGLEKQMARTNQQLSELAQANENIIADLWAIGSRHRNPLRISTGKQNHERRCSDRSG